MSNLLPPNATPLEHALDDAITASYAGVDVPQKTLWNPDTCPAELLPWLAWALSVDYWDSNWSEAEKRDAIKNSFYIHRHKGTVGALKAALSGLDVTLEEGWQQAPAGTPHTFDLIVDVSTRGASKAQMLSLDERVNNTKPVRSHFDLRLRFKSLARRFIGAAVLDGETTTVYPQVVRELTSRVSLFYGIGVHSSLITTIYPYMPDELVSRGYRYLGAAVHDCSSTTVYPL